MNTVESSSKLTSDRHAGQHLVAVVAIGNVLRKDDGVAAAAISQLSRNLQEQICFLDAGCYTRDIPAFLEGHKAGIVVDAIASVHGTRTPTLLDLSEPGYRQAIKIDCCHALSWLDELNLFNDSFLLPERITFFGIPAFDAGWGQGLSAELVEVLPDLVQSLSHVIEQALAGEFHA